MFPEFFHYLAPVWQWLLILLNIVIVPIAVGHVLLRQRDSRIAAFWAVIIAFIPLIGAVWYSLFGINRIERRGKKLRAAMDVEKAAAAEACPPSAWGTVPELNQLHSLALTLGKLSRLGFTIGNHVVPMHSEEAMLAMLDTIKSAERSITLCSFIFEAEGIGAEFVRALEDADKRGVQVRVIVDDMGTRYSWPRIIRVLSKRGLRAHSFMHQHLFFRLLSMNLRNHRKIMVVDGTIGFTGGMNIRPGNMLSTNPCHPCLDMHFRVDGPVVRQLQRVFAEDWAFCTGEVLSGEVWYPELKQHGEIGVIGVPDGPDEDIELMPKVIFAALTSAQHKVRIMTPYFLPDPPLIWALNAAALRGVDVQIITPRNNNLPYVRWAARTLYPQMLERGVRILEAEGHFDHSKFMTVDGLWSLIGSTNWDPRSLRLNFEFNLACFDDKLARQLDQEFTKKLEVCKAVTMEELTAAPLPSRIRDGVARMFIPIL
jgi:cardiolipin synthase A/B